MHMSATGREIFDAMNAKIQPNDESFEIANCTDNGLEINKREINQFIVGVTKQDYSSASTSEYEAKIAKRLSDVSGNIVTLGWSFTYDEMDLMKSALSDLSDLYKIEMDIDKMIANLNAHKDKRGRYYIVVTAVKYIVAIAS